MRAKLEFDLPEEQWEHDAALNGGIYKSEISDFDNYLRAQIKYGLEEPIKELKIEEEKVADLLQLLRDKLHETCSKALSDD